MLKHITRFFPILFTILITCSSLIEADIKELSNCPVRFAVIGDRTGDHVPGIYGRIVEEIERLKPDFVLTVGDMIEGYTDDTTAVNNEWDEYKSLIAPLSMPIYYTPGNHDIWDDASQELYERHIGKPYYSFDKDYLHFIILDNSRWESSTELPKEQIDWLIDDLYQNQEATYTFVFIHKPFWYETVANNEQDTLHGLFRDLGVDAVFTGHYHIYFSGEYDGILYTSVGSSGGDCTPGPTGIEYHFMWVTVDGEGISIAPIKMDAVLPWEDVTAADLKFIDKIYLLGMSFQKSLPVDKNLNLIENNLVVKLRNLSDFEVDDTVHWEAPEAWTVMPVKLPVKILPRDSILASFKVEKKGDLYPAPSLSLDFPYSEGKTYQIEKWLTIARRAYCYGVKTHITIDGEIKESDWEDPVTLFFSPQGNPMEIDPVRFYFAHDHENLFIAAYCKESNMDSMVATVIEHDGPVYGEDCVGYFIQPNIDLGTVYQIYLNSLETVFDQKILKTPEGKIDVDREWNGMYEVAAIRGNDYWSIEARIPLNQFEFAPGEEWGINFRRKQKRYNSTADWQVPISYDPSTYGFLIMK